MKLLDTIRHARELKAEAESHYPAWHVAIETHAPLTFSAEGRKKLNVQYDAELAREIGRATYCHAKDAMQTITKETASVRTALFSAREALGIFGLMLEPTIYRVSEYRSMAKLVSTRFEMYNPARAKMLDEE